MHHFRKENQDKMAEPTEDSGSKQMNVVVKTPKDKETIQIDEKASVKEVFVLLV